MSDPSAEHATSAAHEARSRAAVEKVKADQEIIVPEGHRFGEQMTASQKFFYRLLWLFVVFVSRTYFRVRMRGVEKVPTQGAFILSPIHRSNLDTPLIANITRRRLRYMGKESLWKSRFGAWFLTTAGGFPVDRSTAEQTTVDRGALDASLEVLERGEPLVMFPEGTRQFGPTVCEMFHGPAYVAIRTQSPIVPVGLGGTEAAMGKGTKIPKPKRLTIVVGDPIQPPPKGPSGRVSRKAVLALTEQLGEEIQRLFDEAQAWAGTPNRY